MPSHPDFDTPSDFEEELAKLEDAYIDARVPGIPKERSGSWTSAGWRPSDEGIAQRAKQAAARAEFYKEVLRRVWHFGPMDNDLIEMTTLDSKQREFIKPYPNDGD